MPLGTGGGAGGGAGGVRAGAAFVEIMGKDKLAGLLDKLQKRFAGFSSFFGKTAAAAGGAGAAILAPITALFSAGVDRAAGMQKMADSLGLPVEQLSRLQHAADVAGVALDEVMANPARFGDLIAEAPGMDEATGRKALETQREMNRIQIALKESTLGLLDAALPLLTTVKTLVKDYGGLITVAAGVGAGLVALGVAAAGVSAAFGAVAAAAGVLSAAVGAILSPVGLAVAALGGIGYVLATQTDAGRELTATIGDGLMGVVETAKTAGGGIKDALAVGDLGLAWKIALAGFNVEWTKFTSFLGNNWKAAKNVFLDVWDEVVTGLRLVWNDFDAWFGDSLLGLLQWANRHFSDAFRGFLRTAATVAGALGDDAFAGSLRAIADAGVGQLNDVIQNARDAVGDQAAANQNQILGEQRAAREGRDAELVGVMREGMEAVAAAERELADLVGQAGRAADARAPLVGAAIPRDLGQIATRGGFGGAALGQQFGAGNQFQKRVVDIGLAIQTAVRELATNAVALVAK